MVLSGFMKKILIFLINIGFLLITFLIYRLVFFFQYADVSEFHIKDIVRAFLVGLRFDLATSVYVLAPFVLLIFIPYVSWKDRYLKVMFTLNLCWLILVSIYLFIDLLYYPFSLRHLSFELFNTKGDIVSLIKIGFLEYSIQVLFFCLFLFGICFFYLLLSSKVLKIFSYGNCSFMKKLVSEAASLLIIIAFSIVMARGGFQMKPIKISEAFAFHSPFLGHLALNGVYTTMRTYYSFRTNREMQGWGERSCPQQEAMQKGQAMIVSLEKEEMLDPKYPLYRHFKYKDREFRPLNIVIFIMESWSSKYIGSLGGEEDATPFFSRLSKKGILFKNFFSNGQRSIEAISAIFTSIPPAEGMILSQSGVLSQMPIKFLPAILREKAYKTFFIHGAKRGSMGFDSLMKQTGIETYISKEDLVKAGGRDDGVWGIYDEDTFLYANRLFESQKNPFFAVIFSLSSHTPYKLPSERFKHYKSGTPFYDFLNSIRYSDYALSRFFDEASKMKFFDNTVFIIVGDHTEGKTTGNNLYERFSVPCLLYAPSYIKPMVISKTVTQIDLVPTILDILKSSDAHASFGQSAFHNNPGNGLLAYGNFDVFVRGGWMLVSSMNEIKETYPYLQQPVKGVSYKRTEISAKLKREEDCYLQMFHDLILTNRLYPLSDRDKR
jgi:glucan phosphoethanolaminetransferase (alkaline phosphatase superfamily)